MVAADVGMWTRRLPNPPPYVGGYAYFFSAFTSSTGIVVLWRTSLMVLP